MADVIADSPLKFAHADLEENGYIVVRGKYRQDFHRDMTFDQFPNATVFDSLEEAIQELPTIDGDTFVMAFEEDGICDRLWFTEMQIKNKLTNRLNRYKMCYGGYGTSVYRKDK